MCNFHFIILKRILSSTMNLIRVVVQLRIYLEKFFLLFSRPESAHVSFALLTLNIRRICYHLTCSHSACMVFRSKSLSVVFQRRHLFSISLICFSVKKIFCQYLVICSGIMLLFFAHIFLLFLCFLNHFSVF